MRRPTAVYAAVAAADTVLAANGRSRARRFTKPMLMPLLAVRADRRTRRALALSCAGDVALLGTGQVAFTAGLGSFLAAHLAWIAALGQRGSGGAVRRRPVLALPHLIAWATLNTVLWRHTGRDRLPVVAYSAALTAMAVAALDTGDAKAAAGGTLFVVSDTLLALDRFAGLELPGHEALVMATYTGAQALLASGGVSP